MSASGTATLIRHWRGALGGVVVAVMLATGVLAPLLAPYSYSNQSLLKRLQPPSRPTGSGPTASGVTC